MSYTQIGKTLGCARNTACRYVLSELENLAERCREEAAHVRDLELQRLDDLYLIAYRTIISGNSLAGIDRCLRIMERRAKLLGLDKTGEAGDTGSLGDLVAVLEQMREVRRGD